MKLRFPVLLLLVCALPGFAAARPATADLSEADSRLINAVMSENVAEIRAAARAGADLNADTGKGRTPLIVAAMMSYPKSVSALLELGADPNRDAGDDIVGNSVTAAFFSMNGAALLGRDDGPGPAEHARAIEVLRVLADSHKADLNVLVRRGGPKFTPLMMAAEAGALDAVEILLAAGAKPNTMNDGKCTAIDYAIERATSWSTAPGRVTRGRSVR